MKALKKASHTEGEGELPEAMMTVSTTSLRSADLTLTKHYALVTSRCDVAPDRELLL